MVTEPPSKNQINLVGLPAGRGGGDTKNVM